MNNLSKREKILLFVLLVIAVGASYYYFLHQPLVEKQERLKTQISSLENQHNSILTRIEKIDGLEKELSKLKKERQERLQVVLREPEEILAAVEFFARESGIKIINYQKNEAQNGYPFNLKVEGEYFNSLSFLKMLDNWDYRLVIENFSVNQINTENNKNEISLALNLFYHQSDELRDFKEKAAG